MTKGGPVTQNGKAVVRWNATRHGISSPKPVVPGLENTEDWECHRDGIMDNLAPEAAWKLPSRSAWRYFPGGSTV